MTRTLLVLLMVCIFTWMPNLAAATAQSADELLSQMTLEEKVKLVVGMGMRFPGMQSTTDPTVGQTQDRVPGAAGSTFAVPRLNIPSMVVADGPAGLRITPIREGDSTKTYYATAFPIASLLASTWDTEMIEQVGRAVGNEVREFGVDIILMPALNLHRNPLCGRNFEYYSEDPLIAGSIAAAMVNGIQAQGVGTSIKHFAANNQETNRQSVNVVATARALRELYLKGFEIAVKKSNPWTVMSSYNKINGVYASESPDLLTSILRQDWGFEGFVMTDWFGGKDAVAQMKAGNDLLMPGRPEQAQAILQALQGGQLDVRILDANVKRILNVIQQTPVYKHYAYSDKPDLASHALIARQTGAEGMVLLKNNSATLPLPKDQKIALFGISSYELIVGGTGSGDVNEAYCISLAAALREGGYIPDESISEAYSTYWREAKAKQPKQRNFFMPQPPIPEMAVSAELVDSRIAGNDIAVITIGRNSGEFADRTCADDFNLSDAEQNLIQVVADAFHARHKKVIIVLNIGGVIETASWRDKADAILLAWQPGQEGGRPITDILSGKINPSGKLPMTFPVAYEDTPSAKNFPGQPPEKPEAVIYEEDIFVGYRYFTTFNVQPAYEFGYGLSYTDFDMSDVALSSAVFKDEMTATVSVKNQGARAGRQVMQIYLAAPAKQLHKPAVELKAFAKTRELLPGESEILTFRLDARDLASFDEQRSAWVAEKGQYSLLVGASCLDIKKKVHFKLRKELIVEQVNKALLPQTPINILKNQ